MTKVRSMVWHRRVRAHALHCLWVGSILGVLCMYMGCWNVPSGVSSVDCRCVDCHCVWLARDKLGPMAIACRVDGMFQPNSILVLVGGAGPLCIRVLFLREIIPTGDSEQFVFLLLLFRDQELHDIQNL